MDVKPRREPRVDAAVPLHFKVVDPSEPPGHMTLLEDPAPGVSANVSRGGLALVCDRALEFEQVVVLDVALPGGSVRLFAEVRWCKPSGDGNAHHVGLAVVGYSGEATAQVGAFVEGKLPR